MHAGVANGNDVASPPRVVGSWPDFCRNAHPPGDRGWLAIDMVYWLMKRRHSQAPTSIAAFKANAEAHDAVHDRAHIDPRTGASEVGAALLRRRHAVARVDKHPHYRDGLRLGASDRFVFAVNRRLMQPNAGTTATTKETS
jgi:hypothetical protein